MSDTLTNVAFWLALLQIGYLNLLLSGDNALVIALAVRALPRHKRVLGQLWGAAGAVVLRLLFLGIVMSATMMIQIASHSEAPCRTSDSAPLSDCTSLKAIHTSSRPPTSLRKGTSSRDITMPRNSRRSATAPAAPQSWPSTRL